MNLKSITSCKKAARLLSEQLDHPLPLYKRFLLKMHLVMCANCVCFNRQIKALKKLFGAHEQAENEPPPSSTSTLSDDVRTRIKTSMREDNS